MLDVLFLIATVSVASILAAISVGINAVFDVARRSRSRLPAHKCKLAPACESPSGTEAAARSV